MLTSCMGENGCGTLVRNQDRNQNHQHTATRQASTPDMHRSQMTNYVIPVPGTAIRPAVPAALHQIWQCPASGPMKTA